jgi:hypothetical protein
MFIAFPQNRKRSGIALILNILVNKMATWQSWLHSNVRPMALRPYLSIDLLNIKLIIYYHIELFSGEQGLSQHQLHL